MQVDIRAPVRPTESVERVREAVLNLFPDAVADEAPEGTLRFASRSLEAFRRRVHELRIIDTVRGQMLHGLARDGQTVRFVLSKQAALQRKVSFPAGRHVLGDIDVTVRAEPGDDFTAEQLAWWVCPETRDGEVVGVPGAIPKVP